MWTSNCHLYDYKMTIVWNDMNNDDMDFQCDYQMIIFEHGHWCVTKIWLLCNDMDNIDMENCKWLWND
jgi:hypothetical protein